MSLHGSHSPLSVESKASLGAKGKISPEQAEGIGGQHKAVPPWDLTPPTSGTTKVPKPAGS